MIVFGLLSSVFDILTFRTLRLGFHASPTLSRSGWLIESTITELAVMLVLRTNRLLLPKPPRPCCHPSPSPPSRSHCPTARWPDHSASPPSRPGSWPPSPGRCRGHHPSAPRTGRRTTMTIQRMDNVGVVVDDLEAATAFFVELGLELEGEAAVEGRSVDRVVGLDGVRVDVAMVRTPDGHGRLELMKFHTPAAVSAGPNAPANALGIRRIMFAVEDIEDVLARLRAHGAELVGEVAEYEDSYRLCYVRGPGGIIVALAEQLS